MILVRRRAPPRLALAAPPRSARVRRLHCAVYVRRQGFATTCSPSATGPSARSSMASFPLAIYSNFGRSDGLTPPEAEGAAGGSCMRSDRCYGEICEPR